MAAKSIDSRIKHFFIAFVALFTLSGLGIFIWASQNQTNTASQASGCLDKPNLKYVDSRSLASSGVVYHFKLKNKCPNAKNFFIEASMPTKPVKYDKVWFYNFEDKSTEKNYGYDYYQRVSPEDKDGADIYLFVGRLALVDPNNKSKRINIPDGKYSYVSVKASLEKNPSIYDVVNLNYYVEN